MAVDFELMRTIHRMLRQLTDIDDRLRRGPMKLKLARSNEETFEKSLGEIKEKLTQSKLASKAKELQLGEREAKIVDLQGRLNSADSNKEFQLLKDRIAADEQANSVLSDEILELFEKIDVQDVECKECEENLKQAKADTEKVENTVKAEAESLGEERKRILAEMDVSRKSLHTDVLMHFNRLVKTKGEETFAVTNTETCNNCNFRITSQMVNELLLKKPVFCKGCDAILYLAENHPHSN